MSQSVLDHTHVQDLMSTSCHAIYVLDHTPMTSLSQATPHADLNHILDYTHMHQAHTVQIPHPMKSTFWNHTLMSRPGTTPFCCPHAPVMPSYVLNPHPHDVNLPDHTPIIASISCMNHTPIIILLLCRLVFQHTLSFFNVVPEGL